MTTLDGLNLRTIERDGEPWFLAADVCQVLGHQNTTTALKSHVHEDDKAKFNLGLPGKPLTIVNEMGRYALILGSKKPQARDFKRWITHEVLPTIRRHGMYLTPDTAIKAVEDPAVFMARALVVANELIQKLTVQGKGQRFPLVLLNKHPMELCRFELCTTG